MVSLLLHTSHLSSCTTLDMNTCCVVGSRNGQKNTAAYLKGIQDVEVINARTLAWSLSLLIGPGGMLWLPICSADRVICALCLPTHKADNCSQQQVISRPRYLSQGRINDKRNPISVFFYHKSLFELKSDTVGSGIVHYRCRKIIWPTALSLARSLFIQHRLWNGRCPQTRSAASLTHGNRNPPSWPRSARNENRSARRWKRLITSKRTALNGFQATTDRLSKQGYHHTTECTAERCQFFLKPKRNRQNQHDRRLFQSAVFYCCKIKKIAIKNTKTCARDAVHKAVHAPKRTARRQENRHQKTCHPGGQRMDSGIPIEAWAFYRDGVDFESRTASAQVLSKLRTRLAVNDQEKQQIEEATVGQAKNALWFAYRKKRITASNFGLVLAAVKRKSYSKPCLASTTSKKKDLKHVIGESCMSQGQSRNTLSSLVLLYKGRGLFLFDSGLLGGSPDGTVFGNCMIEVK
ncbi:hypothetical protein F2P79_015524 [Pimephales promelas]|nr:hypothetical protein F2P79_015524 [Pimephales promelas]